MDDERLQNWMYAILRFEVELAEKLSLPIQEALSIKRLVEERSLAESEVERLNALNEKKGCVYFFLPARS